MLREIISFGTFFLSAMVLIVVCSYLLIKEDCHARGEILEVETRYHFLSGCYAKTDDVWVTMRSLYRERNGNNNL